MKRTFKAALAFFALAVLLSVMGNSKSVLAATTKDGSTVTQITAQSADDKTDQVYRTKLVTGPDGYYEVLPVQVSTPGVLALKATGVTVGKDVTVSLHTAADATSANRVGYSVYVYNTTETTERKIDLEKNGTYYLRVETSSSQYSAGLEQEIAFSLRLYPSSKTLKSGKTYRVGQLSYKNYQYYTLKVTGTGYIRVAPGTLATEKYTYSFNVNLFNSKGKVYNKSRYVYLSDGSVVFAVKAGTYKIGVKTSNDLYSIKATFKKYSDQAGASKKKAKAIGKGKTVKSMVLSTDKASKSDWFKFTLSKAAKPKLIFTTDMAVGNLKVKYYQGNKSSFTATVYTNGNKKSKTTLPLGTGWSGSGKLPRGTYYVQVTPSEAGTSGIYSVQLKY